MDAKWCRNSAVADIDRLVNRITELEADVKRLATFGKIHNELAKYPSIPYDLSNLPWLEELKLTADEVKARNEPLIKENLDTYEKIKRLFVAMGLSETQWAKVGRKEQSVTAEWLKSIQKMIPRADGWGEFQRQYDRKKDELTKKAEQLKRESFNAAETKKREEKERQDRFDFVALLVKYSLRSDTDINGLRVHLAGLCPFVKWLYAIDYGTYEDEAEISEVVNKENESLSQKDIRERANQNILADYNRVAAMEF